VLLVGAGVQGSIIAQDQGLVIGTTNGISLPQGNESGNSFQTPILSMTQNGTGAGSLFGSAHQVGLTMPFGKSPEYLPGPISARASCDDACDELRYSLVFAHERNAAFVGSKVGSFRIAS
jgi:hypothetical protein